MHYERIALPITAAVAAGLGYAWLRRRAAGLEDEPGTFVYGYPLEIEDDEVEVWGTEQDLRVDEEMFPGFSQDG